MECTDERLRKASGSAEREHRPPVDITDRKTHEVFGIDRWLWAGSLA